MNPAELDTTHTIEKTLKGHSAFRKIDERLYTVKQGSTYVMITVLPWGVDRALVRCVAQLVKGVAMDGLLALQLLELNAHLRFGAFAYDPDGQLVLFLHSMLGGTTLNAAELLTTLRDVALVADEYDDRIIAKYGGQTMRDLLEEAAMERILARDPRAFKFGSENGSTP